MSSWYLAPCLARLRGEANRLFPLRSKASDGTIGDAAHSARTSDHNPKPDGHGGMVVDAIDLTHDPAHGFDAHGWIRKRTAAADPRIKYAISNRQLWSPGTGWARYTGSNPHEAHVHISVRANMRDSTLPWFPVPQPPPAPTPPNQYPEDAMVRHDCHSPLDDQGNGYIDVAVPASAVISIVPNGDDPSGPAGDVGYKPVPRFSRLAWGAGTRIVVVGGPPRGAVDFAVWVAG